MAVTTLVRLLTEAERAELDTLAREIRERQRRVQELLRTERRRTRELER